MAYVEIALEIIIFVAICSWKLTTPLRTGDNPKRVRWYDRAEVAAQTKKILLAF